MREDHVWPERTVALEGNAGSVPRDEAACSLRANGDVSRHCWRHVPFVKRSRIEFTPDRGSVGRPIDVFAGSVVFPEDGDSVLPPGNALVPGLVIVNLP